MKIFGLMAFGMLVMAGNAEADVKCDPYQGRGFKCSGTLACGKSFLVIELQGGGGGSWHCSATRVGQSPDIVTGGSPISSLPQSTVQQLPADLKAKVQAAQQKAAAPKK